MVCTVFYVRFISLHKNFDFIFDCTFTKISFYAIAFFLVLNCLYVPCYFSFIFYFLSYSPFKYQIYFCYRFPIYMHLFCFLLFTFFYFILFYSILNFSSIFYFIFIRLGFTSGTTPSSSTSTNRECSYESVLVVCVVGGLSFTEVAQVQSVLSEYVTNNSNNVLSSNSDGGQTSYTRVILLSNNSLSPENSLNFIS